MSADDLNELTRNGVLSYMRYWVETFRSPDWSRERILSTVTVGNEFLLMDPIRSGTSVVVALMQVHTSVSKVPASLPSLKSLNLAHSLKNFWSTVKI
jgi:hypothetical protein